MEDLERIQVRLDNIRTIEPILSALRTIALGNWQAALKRRPAVERYAEQMGALLIHLTPRVAITRRRRSVAEPTDGIVTIVVGSERGLCGRFNVTVVEEAERYLAGKQETPGQPTKGTGIELEALGAQADRVLRRRQRLPTRTTGLAAATLPPLRLASELIYRWLGRYEAEEVAGVSLIYNAYRGPGQYEPAVTRIIPPAPPSRTRLTPEDVSWTAPIIETDPRGLYTRAVTQWTIARLYGVLLESAAAEHSARFQLLETASQNAERLIDELTLAIQTGRQREITQEMQELAIGAGLLDQL